MPYQFFATVNGTQYLMHPLDVDKVQVTYERAEGSRDYNIKLSGSLVFKGSEFQLLLAEERSGRRCDEIPLIVMRVCSEELGAVITDDDLTPVTDEDLTELRDAGDPVVFQGSLILNEGEWWIDGCQLSIKATAREAASCIFEKWGEEVNILNQGMEEQVVRWGVDDIEDVTYTATGALGSFPYQIWQGVGSPEAGGWRLKKNLPQDLGGGSYSLASTWVRERKIIPDTQSLGGAWVLRSNTGGFKTYTRPVILYNRVNGASLFYMPNFDHQILGYENPTILSNGLALGDVLNFLCDRICGDYTIVSDFFQINPENPSATNYVTGQPNELTKLVLFQKSDVVNAGAAEDATIAKVTLEKLLKQLNIMFNVEWKVVGDTLRIEHYSYFDEQSIGLDLTLTRYADHVRGGHRYTYLKDQLPAQELFSFREAKYQDFIGFPITYLSNCVSTDPKFKILQKVTEDIITDVQMCFDQLDKQNNLEGLVMIACELIGSDLYIAMDLPKTETYARPNNMLGFAWLHDRYHRHGRAFYDGTMNNTQTQFESIKPKKKGERLSVPLCCGDIFDPKFLVKTMIGNGLVDQSSLSLKDDMLELDLLYVHDWPGSGLGDPPLAVDDSFIINPDQESVLDILGNDTDADNDLAPGTVVITQQPQHGAITFISGSGAVTYQPNNGYLGSDSFKYKVRDGFNQLSNEATATITVSIPNTPPDAVNDSYIGGRNQALIIPGGSGVLNNDTNWEGAGTFTIVAFQSTSANGGTVSLLSNGGFSYTPANNFTGIDSFTYTIRNNQGNEDTATVSINVLDPSQQPWVRIRKVNEVDTTASSPLTGFTRRGNVVIEIFADEAATTPVSVNNLLVNWRQLLTNYIPEPDTVSSTTSQRMINGSSDQVLTNVITRASIYNGAIPIQDFGYDYEIMPGTGYNII